MKIAVLVYGMYREFDIAFKSWNFLEKFDCDVYFSTWTRSKQKNNRLGIVIDETIDINRILEKIPNAKIAIEDDVYSHLHNAEKMIFHWKKCLNMVENSNINYDYLILTRPDNFTIFNLNENDLIQNFAEDKIYGLDQIIKNNDDLFVQDIFFIGKFNTMIKLIKNIPEKIDVNENNGSIHFHLSKHILLNGLSVEKIPNLVVVTVRANARDLKGSNIDVNKIFEKTMEWGENQEQYYENNI